MDNILDLIEKHNLLVRPSITGGWIAGKWQGITCDGKSYCCKNTESEARTIKDAVLASVARLT